jgi:hypothetical protein
MGHFLRSGFREEGAELPRFPAIIKGTQLDFSATLTLWRCTQSRANRSPLGIPAEQGKKQGRNTNSDYDDWVYTFYPAAFRGIIPDGNPRRNRDYY